jgi:hypothetical protein
MVGVGTVRAVLPGRRAVGPVHGKENPRPAPPLAAREYRRKVAPPLDAVDAPRPYHVTGDGGEDFEGAAVFW